MMTRFAIAHEETLVAPIAPEKLDAYGEWLTKKQCATVLQVSVRQVQRWIAERQLRASRLSHKILRIRKQDLVRFTERQAG